MKSLLRQEVAAVTVRPPNGLANSLNVTYGVVTFPPKRRSANTESPRSPARGRPSAVKLAIITKILIERREVFAQDQHAARSLVQERYLLPEDAEQIIEAAKREKPV